MVFIPAADGFVGGGNILASALYVAMTRARSLLYVTGTRMGNGEAGDQVLAILESTYDDLQSPPAIATTSDQADEWADLIERLGDEHRAWFEDLRNHVEINQEPIFDADNSIVAEPLFWFEHDGCTLACFGHEMPSRRVMFLLEDHHIQLIEPGVKLPFAASASR